ncbi:MAG: hypothetical protein M1837_002359 [Sclerophora amabilis]|nr:MAG: hypothetical protein M1837_002359 [Sclerophora amabilis]
MSDTLPGQVGGAQIAPAPTASPSKVPRALSPSPKLREHTIPTKDDVALRQDPITPRRNAFPIGGLSLQLPPRENDNPSVASALQHVPLSPKLDSSSGYGSAASVLPRRSRGLDFSRACTNLHHSTLAEQSSPDSSPTLAGRGVVIPSRKGLSNNWNAQESPSLSSSALWSTQTPAEGPGLSGSVSSSVNMLESDTSSSGSDDEELMDADDGSDPIITTPQVYKISSSDGPFNSTNPFAGVSGASPGGDWMGTYSPAARTLMSFQRARLQKRGSRKGSSSASASGSSSMASPSTSSPPVLKSIETINGYFPREASGKIGRSRRSSLSWNTKDLRLSPSAESDDGGILRASNDRVKEGAASAPPVTPAAEEKRDVVRRQVTRRGNLLPKTKNFSRIQAALIEEHTPVDCEVRREAEVVRQVWESDVDLEPNNHAAHTEIADGSPSSPKESMPPDSDGAHSFNVQAQRNSGGKEFWDNFDGCRRTPPPPLFNQSSSSTVFDDSIMESPTVCTQNTSLVYTDQRNDDQTSQSFPMLSSRSSRASTPQPPPPPSAAEITRKINNKRRRDDDFDESSLKRRAVSPGMSVQNSPILAQSPAQKDGWWGLHKPGREATPAATSTHNAGERASSGGSASSVSAGPTKRVGFQGMCDTNDGLMKMSIE